MPSFSRTRSILSAVLACLSLSGASLASDGVLEINQSCATQTGCFSGDTPGYPITISSAGSYRLTSNLTGIIANTDGIFLTASRVTIDFNGFSLTGPSAGTGVGNGISGTGTIGSAKSTTIKNGVIRGVRGTGIYLPGAPAVRVENMTLDINAGGSLGFVDGAGIYVGEDAQILRNRVTNNGGVTVSGIVTGNSALISENIVSGSGVTGIRCAHGCAVLQNIATENGASGIIVEGHGGTISGNTAYKNTQGGISGGSGSTILGNTAYLNGVDGIYAGSGSTVQNNTVRSNGVYGLALEPDVAYRENVVTDNTMGTVVGGVNMLGNSCNGLTTCP